ncbi:MAG: putative oxidoreductase [Planctomycetes bacterium ADurb.Bin126]|nr:MAG: putative oxidoreductase [Planctomycetes bacterium ADurb.Bin126]HQL73488.1 Gfo/Idh/MocA family oxidoreductase [Phycisphaerae bacterium]
MSTSSSAAVLLSQRLSRRRVLGSAAALGAFSIVPRSVLGAPGAPAPSERPVVAGVGIGGVGHGQIQQCAGAGFHVGVLCDVDSVLADKTFKKFPQARRYRDFREMLAAEGDKIDAVYCGTPDHTHALISLAALKAKKHVLTVKPLTRTIAEGRILAAAAVKAGTMTQMTASPASTESGCRTCEIIAGGIIGDVTEVHIWSDRPLWPHGMTRPAGSDPVPQTFDWDLWLGPAPKRAFVKTWPAGSLTLAQVNRHKANPAVYHPWNFRGWYDFGTGALGDMGCHHWNTPRRALALGHPSAVSASSTRIMDESWPLASVITYEFPARQADGRTLPPVQITWYDGGLKPPRPVELEPGRKMPGSGILYRGSKGVMMASGTSEVPRLLPEEKMKAFTLPPNTLKRRGGIYSEWFEAVRGGEKPSEHWPDCAVPLTELVLLGCIAVRTGQYLQWDGPNMRFANSADANKLITPDYQNGWKLEG